MREIKFRGWDGKEMLEHWDILGNHSDYFLDESGVLMERSWTPSGQGTPTSTNIILMQYTGLKDSKGVEIYEGDIVKWQTYINDNDIDEQIIDPVIFQSGSFTFHDFALVESTPEAIEGSTIEIIGNIYENPELVGDEGAVYKSARQAYEDKRKVQ